MRGYTLKAELVHSCRIRFTLLDKNKVVLMAVEYIEWDGICEVVFRHVHRAAVGNRRLQIRFNALVKLRLERLGWLVIQREK